MPRGRVKQLLHTAEFRVVSTRGRMPLCSGDRWQHLFSRGDSLLRIKDGLNEKNYCLVCARAILEKGQQDLEKLLIELEARARRDYES